MALKRLMNLTIISFLVSFDFDQNIYELEQYEKIIETLTLISVCLFIEKSIRNHYII